MEKLELTEISVTYSELTTKIKTHLALIGKRAKDANGESVFSEITTSTTEDAKVWVDFINLGVEYILAALVDFGLMESTGCYTDADKIKFQLGSTRWDAIGEKRDNGTADGYSVHRNFIIPLKSAIIKYLWMFAVYQYLSVIRPAASEKGVPPYAIAYERECEQAMLAIHTIANTKRAPEILSSEYYSSIKGEIVNEG